MYTKFTQIALIVLLFIAISCSTNSDLVPELNIVGTWRFQSATGSATVGIQNKDLKYDLEVSNNGVSQKIKKTLTWVFNENGTGTQDGASITYKVSGNTLTITKNTKTFSVNINLKDGQLDITEDEVGIKSIIDDFNASLSGNKITKYNRTSNYKSLKEILSTNGTPDCLVKTYTSKDENFETTSEYFYNDENKVIAITSKSYSLTFGNETISNYTYEETESNIGSDVKPYITKFNNGIIAEKIFCDKNKRINRRESFSSSPEDKYPVFIDYEEYDIIGNNTRTSTYLYDGLTGEKYNYFLIYDVEYSNGNLSKLYSTKYNSSKYLVSEIVDWTSNPAKTKIVYLYNYGNLSFNDNNKYHPSKSIYYDQTGKISYETNIKYTFNDKGYILASEAITTNGKKSTVAYTYMCK